MNLGILYIVVKSLTEHTFSFNFFLIIYLLMLSITVKVFLLLTNKHRLYVGLVSCLYIFLSILLNGYFPPPPIIITWIIKSVCTFSTFYLCLQYSYYSKKVVLISSLPGILMGLFGTILKLYQTPIEPEIKQYVPFLNNYLEAFQHIIKNNLLIEFISDAPFQYFVFGISILLTILQNIMFCMGIYSCIIHFLLKNKKTSY